MFKSRDVMLKISWFSIDFYCVTFYVGNNKGQQTQQKPRSAGAVKTHSSDGSQSSEVPRSSSRGRQEQPSAVTRGNRRRPYPSHYYSRGGYTDSYYQYNDNYYTYGNQRYWDKQGQL